MVQRANGRSRRIHLTGDRGNLSLKFGESGGKEAICATAQVPQTQVWGVPTGEPLVTALVGMQSFTVDEGVSGQVLDLDPDAPKVDYMDDWAAGDYTEEAYIAAYHSASGGGIADTLITDSSTVQYNGNNTESGDFIDSFEVDDTSANTSTKDIRVYYVVKRGYSYIQKRSSGKSNVSEELQREDSIKWAFSNPDAPDADRQVTWDSGISGLQGVIPPKFYVDIVYFDKDTGLIPLADVNASNLYIDVPLKQRPLGPDEEPAALRRRVRREMSG